VSPPQHLFGGDWTEDKLRAVREYLDAYVKVMKNQPFVTAYIDAFAGTGTVALRDTEDSGEPLFPELVDEGVGRYLVGSARQALEVAPPFHKYVFIEQSGGNVAQLEAMTREFHDLENRIQIRKDDANRRVKAICETWDWRSHRAVLFLDPFGMQVDWETIEAVAATKAIDMWYLFPVGAVCRCMPRDGKAQPGWEDRLDSALGTKVWRDLFYDISRKQTLLGEESCLERTATYQDVCNFFTLRLKDAFADVVASSDALRNGRGSPMYLLFFAVANPSKKARGAAMRIASHILRMKG
jgi:three-Cys-motif partner protein